jgi:hypothetical protein
MYSSLTMSEILNSPVALLFVVGFLGLLFPLLVIAFYFSMRKSGLSNALKLKSISSEGVRIVTETVLLGHRDVSALIFFYNHHFSKVVLYPQAISYSFFGIERGVSLSDVEHVDVYKGSWILFYFIPFALISSSSRIIVSFKNKKVTLSFTMYSSKQVVEVLNYFKDHNVSLTSTTIEYINNQNISR